MDSLDQPMFHDTPSENYGARFNTKKEFSFNRNAQQASEIQKKYCSLTQDLHKLQQQDLIDLLLEQIQENEKNKNWLFKKDIQIDKIRQENKQLSQLLVKKKSAVALLCETQMKNLNLIEKLEMQIRNHGQLQKDTHYEKKYRELAMYMDQYINNINEAQEEFKRNYTLLKSQNIRLHLQVQKQSTNCLELEKRNQLLHQQIAKGQTMLTQYREKLQKTSKQIEKYKCQCQSLKKCLDEHQSSIKFSDRIQFIQDHYLSSQLDFIRQKLQENESISKDIIEKYEQTKQGFQKILKEKQQAIYLYQKANQRCKHLQKQLHQAKNIEERYKKQIIVLQSQIKEMRQRQNMLQRQYDCQRIQKQSVKKQLFQMVQQVRLMQDGYKRQLEQSQKIRQELHNFWEKKERRSKICSQQNEHQLSKSSQRKQYRQDPKSSYDLSSREKYGNQNYIKESIILSDVKMNYSQSTINQPAQSKTWQYRQKEHQNQINSKSSFKKKTVIDSNKENC